MAKVELVGVKKQFGAVQVIHGIDLEINDGEFVVFVGPSGCGKSTALRMICGLETMSEGDIRIADTSVRNVSPSKTRHSHGVPILRSIPTHDRGRKHGFFTPDGG